jgi:hypothetical protein
MNSLADICATGALLFDRASLCALLCRVPSSQIGRAFGFASMGASLILGSVSDGISRTWSGNGGKGEWEGEIIVTPGDRGHALECRPGALRPVRTRRPLITHTRLRGRAGPVPGHVRSTTMPGHVRLAPEQATRPCVCVCV